MIESPQGKLDKNGKPLKFSRDLESDWTTIDDEPYYSLKEHASVNVNNGFILATIMTPASYHISQASKTKGALGPSLPRP